MNNKLQLTLRGVLILVGLSLVLTGCVTTETGVFTKKTNETKALGHTVQLAKRYMSERKWEQAKRHLKIALEMDDESAAVHEAMALVFQNTGELDRAEIHYKKSLNLDPSLSRVRLNYGAYLYNSKHFNEAVKELNIVVQDSLYERRYVAYINLGRSYYALLRYAEAEKSLNTAYLMRSRHHPALFMKMAEVYYNLGQYPKSQEFFDRYNTQVKSKSAVALLLGARLAKQFDDKNAISSYGLALKNLFPRTQQYLDYQQEFVNGS
ncbi:MAG: type IV pilus assembly protein PilF [Pseudohongiellaceae bacterium]|jgi:type IV pilus assembly protein PilF